MGFKPTYLILFSIVFALDGLTLNGAFASEGAAVYLPKPTSNVSEKDGGGAMDLLTSTKPLSQGPDDAAREGSMREGMQSIRLQSSLQTPIVPAYNSVRPLPVTQ